MNVFITIIIIIIIQQDPDDEDNIEVNADSYVVVYSITDKNSFDTAVQILYRLRHCMDSDRPIVLVGNKADLVRKRKVKKEGKYILTYNSKPLLQRISLDFLCEA